MDEFGEHPILLRILINHNRLIKYFGPFLKIEQELVFFDESCLVVIKVFGLLLLSNYLLDTVPIFRPIVLSYSIKLGRQHSLVRVVDVEADEEFALVAGCLLLPLLLDLRQLLYHGVLQIVPNIEAFHCIGTSKCDYDHFYFNEIF